MTNGRLVAQGHDCSSGVMFSFQDAFSIVAAGGWLSEPMTVIVVLCAHYRKCLNV